METLTPSPSSPRAGGSEFEVFLSFRGEDTRNRFIGHLYERLEERGISTFIDSEKLEKGEEIDNLLEYIKSSKIFVPIFSKRFAESKWCLKEVTRSVDCGKEMIPVFFDVDPSDVRNQTGPFRSAFEKHESDKELNQEEVRNWREALKKVGNLSGFTLKEMNGDEAKLKRAVIERVLTRLNKKSLEVAKHPVGIATRVNDVKKMLENGGNINGVHVVGIHGMGGLGKTVIAKAVYNDLEEEFNGATCFISNVRENAGQPNGLVNLQKQFIGDVLKEKNTSLGNVAQGKIMIKDRVSRKRVLLILDDVDSGEQLDALAGGSDWFGSGSVIIITTRDEGVLLAHNVKEDDIYRPQELNEDQSRKLFMRHAFNGEQPQGEYVQLSNQVVAAAGGLPLALKVIGSLLSSKRNVQEWKDTLEKLKKTPPSEVQQRLKRSYDNLQDLEKKIFLDIACFFIGKNRKNATYMWEGCVWFPNAAVKILVQKSLLKIRVIDGMNEKYELFEMHDQIRDMGRAIVDEDCAQNRQKKSRLWDNQDSWDLLQRKLPGVTDAEGIQILRKDEPFNEKYCVSAECFENMRKLRYLHAEHVNFQGTFPCVLTDLKWLELERCHFDSPPPDFNLEKLVILRLNETNIAPILINQLSLRLKVFEKLKVLSLRRVKTKITLDFTLTPSLVKLQFRNCSALTTIDESIGKLKNLTHLSTRDCRFLRILPDSIWQLSSLEVLNISGCINLSSFPERFGELGSLKKLDLSDTRVQTVPDSICQLKLMKSLDLSRCHSLCSLPERLGDMEKLEELILDNTKIEIIPDSVGQLKSLHLLSLDGCKLLKALPISIRQLSSLQQLNMPGTGLRSSENDLPHDAAINIIEFIGSSSELLGLCKQRHKALEILHLSDAIIEELPDCIGRMENLKELRLKCVMLKELPNWTEGYLENLTQLEIRSMHLKALPDCIGSLIHLWRLKLICPNLEILPNSIGELEGLEHLYLHCNTASLNFIMRLENLQTFLFKSKKLKFLDATILGCLGRLHHLCLGGCENLEHIMYQTNIGLGCLSSLESLDLKDCKRLYSLPQLPSSLRSLNASGCTELRRISDISNLKNLKNLCLVGCKHLLDVPGLEIVSSNLEVLELPSPWISWRSAALVMISKTKCSRLLKTWKG